MCLHGNIFVTAFLFFVLSFSSHYVFLRLISVVLNTIVLCWVMTWKNKVGIFFNVNNIWLVTKWKCTDFFNNVWQLFCYNVNYCRNCRQYWYSKTVFWIFWLFCIFFNISTLFLLKKYRSEARTLHADLGLFKVH